jgi:hypothetical protein
VEVVAVDVLKDEDVVGVGATVVVVSVVVGTAVDVVAAISVPDVVLLQPIAIAARASAASQRR